MTEEELKKVKKLLKNAHSDLRCIGSSTYALSAMSDIEKAFKIIFGYKM